MALEASGLQTILPTSSALDLEISTFSLTGGAGLRLSGVREAGVLALVRRGPSVEESALLAVFGLLFGLYPGVGLAVVGVDEDPRPRVPDLGSSRQTDLSSLLIVHVSPL